MLTTGAWTYAVCKVNKPYPKKDQFGIDAIPPPPPPYPTPIRSQLADTSKVILSGISQNLGLKPKRVHWPREQ